MIRRKADGSGEGSRGGHVIGHTKSGKSIYAPNEGHTDAGSADLTQRGHAFAAEHSVGYSASDHFAAHKAIMAEAKKALAAGKTALAYHLGAVASGHKQLAHDRGAYGAAAARGTN
jgi:hypothetical protein